MKNFILVKLILILVSVNAYGEVKRINEKQERTETALKADEAFWDLIHGTKNYQNFDSVMLKLAKAQNRDPFDVYTTAHIGFANFWAVSEGIGLGVAQGENGLQYLQNAEHAFDIANALAPYEPRLLGFLGYSRISLGITTQNYPLLIQGLDNVARSVELWPEWAHFGAAYGIDVAASFNTPAFEQALSHYWDNLDVCANVTVDRSNPDFFSYLIQETLEGPDRACWDSWIAPYNFEGFFLVMGDALVKAGQTNIALIIYNNAKLAKNYDSWPFRPLLESRITNVILNVDKFRKAVIPGQTNDPISTQISATAISCGICHQGDSDRYYEPPDWVGERANEYLLPY